VKRDRDRLLLRFASPLQLDPEPALQRLAGYVDRSLPGRDGNELVLLLAPGTTDQLSVYEHRIMVLDLTRPERPPSAASVVFEADPDDPRIVIGGRGATAPDVGLEGGVYRLTFLDLGPIPEVELLAAKAGMGPWLSDLRLERNGEASVLSLHLREGVAASVQQQGGETVIELTPPEPVSAGTAVVCPPPPKPSAAAGSTVAAGQKKPVGDAIMDDDAWLVFDSREPAGAAVFLRAGFLWMVFGAPVDLATTALPAPVPAAFSDILGPGELIAASGATAVRYPASGRLHVDVRRRDAAWLVRPVDTQVEAPAATPIHRGPNEVILAIPDTGFGKIVTFRDPEVGDHLQAVPLSAERQALPERRRLVGLELLPTAQGLLWRSLDDQLEVERSDRGLIFQLGGEELTSNGQAVLDHRSAGETPPVPAERPGKEQSEVEPPEETAQEGVQSAEGLAAEEAVGPPPLPTDLLGFRNRDLDSGDVAERRRRLRVAIAEASGPERSRLLLDLARLLLAHDLALEARTVLGRIDQGSDPDPAHLLARNALAGAADFLIEPKVGASSFLTSSALDRDPEIEIWRAAIAATNERWDEAAAKWPTLSKDLESYPRSLRVHFGLLALETAIGQKDEDMIRKSRRPFRRLDLEPREAQRLDLLLAEGDAMAPGAETALDTLGGLERSGHQDLRTTAGFERAARMLSTAADPLNKLDELARKRPLWRGHPREGGMLSRLASLYHDARIPRAALETWRELRKRYPDAAEQLGVTDLMTATFRRAVTDAGSFAIDPLEAYLIYLDFHELAPEGDEGERMRRQLAMHLDELDLNDEAASLIAGLAEQLPEGAERAEAGAMIAEFRLQNRDADLALVVLDATIASNLPAAVSARRKLARAEALGLVKDYSGALKALEGLSDIPAARVRADLLWQKRDWTALSDALEVLVDQTMATDNPLAMPDQIVLLKLAMAFGKSGNSEALVQLEERFAEAFAGLPLENAFLVATQTFKNARDVPNLISSTDRYLAHLDGMKAGPIFVD
jgi:hypothetical protein